MVTSNRRDYYFDTLKGLLIMAVVIGNSLEFANPQSVNVHYFILFLYIFHMPLFTFISGYFCKLSNRTTVDKVKHTFLIFVSAEVCYFMFNYIILHETSSKLQLLYPEWTLWYLLSLTIWYILYDYIKNPKIWLVVSILISLLIGFDTSVGPYGSVSRTLFFLPFFILGIMFKKEYLENLKKHKFKILFSSICILIILYIISPNIKVDLLFESHSYATYYENNEIVPFFIRIFHYIGAISLGALILCITPSTRTKLSYIGRYSLYIYILHSGVSKVLISFGIARYNNIFLLILSEALILVTTILISFGYLKVKPKLKTLLYCNKK